MRKILLLFATVFGGSVVLLITSGTILYISKLKHWITLENWQGVAMLLTLPLCFISGAGVLLVVAIMDLRGRFKKPLDLVNPPDKP